MVCFIFLFSEVLCLTLLMQQAFWWWISHFFFAWESHSLSIWRLTFCILSSRLIFFLIPPSMFHLSPLAWMVPCEISTVILFVDPLQVLFWVPFLLSFSIFSLFLVFCSWNMIWLSTVFIGILLCLVFSELPESVIECLNAFQIISNFFSKKDSISFLPFWYSSYI